MKFSASLLIITTLLRLGKSTQAMHQSAFDAEYQELPEEESQRFLADVCGTYYYTTTIGMDSKQSLTCSDSQLKIIGAKLDALYDEVVSLDQALSNVALSTTVCPTPMVTNRRRDLLSHGSDEHLFSDEAHESHRKLRNRLRYNWSGTGSCYLCSTDNKDYRRDLSDVEAQHHEERELREAYSVIDFSKDSNGNPVTNGQYVMDQWRSKYGMRVIVEDARGGYAPGGKARIFDSTRPTGDDFDLGTPNAKCPGGGPGIGIDGVPGKRGENCIPQGNLLIIQESNKPEPDDNVVGGIMSFVFDSPRRIGHIRIIDGSNTLEATTPDGKIVSFKFPSFGENAAQMLHLDIVVTKMRMIISGGGGISEIGIFTPTQANHALSPESRSYIAKKSPLEELIPYLEFDLSYYLTTRINQIYGGVSSSCLYNKWVYIVVQMNAVKNAPRSSCT